MTALFVHLPDEDEDRVPPFDEQLIARWLPKLGPTAMWIMVLLWRDLLHVPAGTQVEVDAADLARRLGVSPRQLHRSLERLHRFQIVFYSPAHGLLAADGTLPA